MRTSKFFFFIILSICTTTISAQTFGVRAGLNYSKFLGDTETGPGVDESHGFSNGFHFGLTYAVDFTDLFSIRTELVYIQNGSKYNYDGQSYYIIRETANKVTYEKGQVEYELNISNAYISIPIMANYRVSNKWEIFGGPYVNLLIGPIGRGKMRFVSDSRPDDIFFRQSLDFNYGSDNAIEVTGSSPTQSDQLGIWVDGNIVRLPKFAGAYYQQGEKTGNRFNPWDYGITAGVHYFLNRGFYVGFQVDFGLSDLTNNEVDISLKEVNPDNSFIFSDDKDTHLGIHTSFGFRF